MEVEGKIVFKGVDLASAAASAEASPMLCESVSLAACARDTPDSVVNKRLLPGDGEFDIAAFLQALWSVGYDGPIGVEVLNEYIRKWDLKTAATEAFAKTQRVVAAARQAGK